MDAYLSHKLKTLSFILMLMVVYLHAFNLNISIKGEPLSIGLGYNVFIQNFISQGITRIAVPLFFLISGYLFFFNIKKGSIAVFLEKYKKRFKTLVIPYVFWAVFWFLFYLAIRSNAVFRPYLTDKVAGNYAIKHFIDIVLRLPVSYQLWFVKDLILLVVFSPLFYGLIKRFSYFVILLPFITWFYDFNYIVFSSEALLFFLIGAFISIKKRNCINKNFIKNPKVLFAVWLFLVTLKTGLLLLNFDTKLGLLLLHKISILIGLIAIWSMYDFILLKKESHNLKSPKLFEYAFFLYVFHEPILGFLTKLLFVAFGTTALNSLLIYLTAPVITITLAVGIGMLLKKFTKPFYLVITGGR